MFLDHVAYGLVDARALGDRDLLHHPPSKTSLGLDIQEAFRYMLHAILSCLMYHIAGICMRMFEMKTGSATEEIVCGRAYMKLPELISAMQTYARYRRCSMKTGCR